ncbi:unnamed protein product [Amoebophrya sp. A25]|nr:unnamed protein product [Amoebophrya sp. A25]|eukprot:GSA25T00021894001.1
MSDSTAVSAQGSKILFGRLLQERKVLTEEYELLAEGGIYVDWGDEMQSLRAMIIGPKDTPYEDGFFFFDVKIPSQYPFVPPSVTFRTTDHRVRFHPNLYIEGKVCLSILGTWPNGPAWQTCMSIKSVLLTIQSILAAHPLTNEPGYEKEVNTEKDKLYSKMIDFESINVAIYRMLRHPPETYDFFVPMMRLRFLDAYDSLEKRLQNFIDSHPQMKTEALPSSKDSCSTSASTPVGSSSPECTSEQEKENQKPAAAPKNLIRDATKGISSSPQKSTSLLDACYVQHEAKARATKNAYGSEAGYVLQGEVGDDGPPWYSSMGKGTSSLSGSGSSSNAAILGQLKGGKKGPVEMLELLNEKAEKGDQIAKKMLNKHHSLYGDNLLNGPLGSSNNASTTSSSTSTTAPPTKSLSSEGPSTSATATNATTSNVKVIQRTGINVTAVGGAANVVTAPIYKFQSSFSTAKILLDELEAMKNQIEEALDEEEDSDEDEA